MKRRILELESQLSYEKQKAIKEREELQSKADTRNQENERVIALQRQQIEAKSEKIMVRILF